jgi:Tol biopolymer transport system component
VVEVTWSDIDDGGTYTPGAMTLLNRLGTWRAGGPGGSSYRGWYQNIDYAWSPDGTKLAYDRWASSNATAPDLLVLVVANGTANELSRTPLRTMTRPGDWSSQGKLLCGEYQNWTVCSMSVSSDGTSYSSYVELVPPPRSGGIQYNDWRWSPGGNYAVYSLYNYSNASKAFMDVRRVNADGTGDTNLTGDVSGNAWPLAWR